MKVTILCGLEEPFQMISFIVRLICDLLLDPEYKKFLEYYNADDEKFTSTPETLLEEIEAKSKELVGVY